MSDSNPTRRLDRTTAWIACALLVSGAAFATEQAKERQEGRDAKQEAKQEGRQNKVDCKADDQKSNSECRQEKRDTKQGGREEKREIKR